MVKILQKEDPILRKEAEAVEPFEIGTPAFQKIVADMREAMHSQDDAVAIAAPQIGVSKCIFVVAEKVFNMLHPKPEGEKAWEDMVFVNPFIIKISRDKKQMEEGCLSVRHLYGSTRRASRVTIEATDERGVHFQMTGTGLIAQIFQHECDHLHGILFTDSATDVHEVLPEKK